MKYFLLLLTLPLLLGTCAKDNGVSPSNPVIGRWSLSAMLDSTGKWRSFNPFIPVVVEFRANGTTDQINYLNGQPQRNCCQPTRYTYEPLDCPANAVCNRLGTITYTDWVRCSGATCVLPKTLAVVGLTNTHLDVAVGGPTAPLRYQRIE